MYQVGDRFNNMRRGSYMTIVGRHESIVYGLGDEPYRNTTYTLKGLRTGKEVIVTEEDIDRWMSIRVLTIRENVIEPIQWLRPLEFSTTT